VRIDDFVVLTSGSDGEVRIGNHVHIAAHAALFGGGGIILEDFTSLSGRVSVYSATDGYGGEALTNPTVPSQYTSVLKAPVVLRRHSLVGAASVLLPGVTLDEGCAVGAMSLVNRDLASWGLYVGVPARRIRDRSQALLEMERGLLEDEARGINLG
jgi:galactoside O-acetyltransferase